MLPLISLTEHLTWGNHLTGHEKKKIQKFDRFWGTQEHLCKV